MSLDGYEVVKPKVSIRMYWVEIALLAASLATPVVVYAVWGTGGKLGRSGSVMVFFAALAEFTTLNRLNRKHLLNAARVRAGEAPWNFSTPSRLVGWVSLIAALVGTLVWGYGDLL